MAVTLCAGKYFHPCQTYPLDQANTHPLTDDARGTITYTQYSKFSPWFLFIFLPHDWAMGTPPDRRSGF